MATSRSEQQLLRTTDLAMATYLTMEGFTPILVQAHGDVVKPGHPQGAWEFKETPTLRGLVDEFREGTACVEPDGYAKLLKQVRREMFTFLGIGK